MTATPLASVGSVKFAIPEIALAAASLLVVAWNLGVRDATRRQLGARAITLAALAVSATGSAAGLFGVARLPVPALLFDGQLACDGFACAFRVFFALVTAFVVVAAIPPRSARPEVPERFALLLLACLGMNLMAMGRTLLVLYMAIEIVSVACFVLVGSRRGAGRRGRSSEAALKHVVLGGVASGVMVYGMSWLYGVTRSLDLPEIAERVATLTREQGHLPNAVAVGVACVLAGLAYKVSAAPFHMWAPDVYEGAPTLVSAFLSVAPVAAGFAVLVRFFREAPAGSSALTESQAPWPVLMGGIAVVTMTIANLCALGQTNLKRLLAYSAIAHAGTMLLALSVPGDEGQSAILFYLVPYGAMILGAFFVVFALGEAAAPADEASLANGTNGSDGTSETIDGLRGLGARSPGMAAALAVFLFSLVGLPPFAGFAGKLYVLVTLVRGAGAGDYRSWYFFLAVAAVANTAVSFFYYSRVLRAMYLADGLAGQDGPVSVRPLHTILTALLAVPTVVLGVWWAPFYAFITRTMTLIR